MTLPEGWAEATVDDLGEYLNGMAFKPSDWEDEGIGIIRIQNLTDQSKPLNKTQRAFDERYRVRKGDLLVSWSATLDAFIWDREDAVLNQHIFKVTPSGCVDRHFLFYQLRETIAEMAASEHLHGSTMKHINRGPFLAHCTALPPMAEQRRIVTKLDALTARLTRVRAELDRVPMLAEREHLALLRAGVTGLLTEEWRGVSDAEPIASTLARVPNPKQGRGGREATDKVIPGTAGIAVNDPATELPPGWAWVPLLRVAKQETGHTPSRSQPEYWDGGVPWIGIRDAGAHHGCVIETTMQTISEAGLDNSSARLLPAGTVCLSRTASVGYVTKMKTSMATSQDFATWTCTEALLPEYLLYALMAEGDDIRRFGMGSTHTTIYFPEIRAFHIALPPVEEQREIVDRLKTALARADRMKVEAARAGALIDRLEAAILGRAFRGELVPQDPDDEPASVLLDRIRAQRAAAPKPKRGRRKQAQ